jgi:YbbR domain-containing protein
MIQLLRDVFFADFWLKLFSFTLAILIWLTVSFAIEKGKGSSAPLIVPPQVRTFSKVPVRKMSAAEDVRHLKVNPSEVEVTVQGEANLIRGLGPGDIRAMVDLSGIETSHDLRKRLEVSTLAGISLVKIEPPEVEIVFPASK